MNGPDLNHSDDTVAGISRRRCGGGFAYYTPSGHLIRDKRVRRRLEALVIPPAWYDVWISPDPKGHIQATGHDDKGRKQYIYHPDWTRWRTESKFGQTVEFARNLPDLRQRVERDLRKRRLGEDLILATTVRILDRTLMRVGNSQYEQQNDSFGLTTLKACHVNLANGREIKFKFPGKGGKPFSANLADRRVAKVLRRLEGLPGQHLFQYLDEGGAPRSVTSDAVNDYIRDACGEVFSTKNFRTWAGTVIAAAELCRHEPPADDHAVRRTINTAVRKAARRLGNTLTVCRESYVHPAVIDGFREGKLRSVSSAIERYKVRRGSSVAGLSPEEYSVLKFLKRAERCRPR